MSLIMSLPSPKALQSFWMPFTPNRSFKAKPKLLASAKGMFYYDEDGREFLEGTAELWCVIAGHGRDKITKAIQA
jgi:beta-alanine--pyruvate transaminase